MCDQKHLAGVQLKHAAAALRDVDADGTFSGYASLFNQTDLSRDCVMTGAFSRSLASRGTAGVKLLYQHNPAEPIGAWLTIKEDSRGLFVRGRLMTEITRARETLSLMRAGVLDGLSIGFRTVRGRSERKTGVRRLMEIDLWEISIVTFPMLPGARIADVKSTQDRSTEFRRLQDHAIRRQELRIASRSVERALSGRRDAVADAMTSDLAGRLRTMAHRLEPKRTR